MHIEDQSDAIAFLQSPETYGLSEDIRRIETHISIVFLAGDRAYKLKRAIRLPYVDFSSLALRRTYCEREVDLNGRATPELYLGVRVITRQADGSLAFDGPGEPLDIVVEMVRFSQQDLFDRMAADGKLTLALMEETATIIAGFHATAPVVRETSGSQNMAGVLTINEAGFATSHVFDTESVTELTGTFRRVWADHARTLDEREKAGKVRLCHGDLHLRNIVMSPAGPRLFDCIDFNDQIATVDVLYDLAFLLMDLWHRGHADLASIVMNRYLDQTADEEGYPLLPFFMAVRAAVRAHVTATQVEEGAGDLGKLARSARSYFALAESLLAPRQPHFVVVGGLSGTGKSTVSERLAPLVGGAPGARIEESDRIRKAMFGVSPNERLPLAAYQENVSQKVYDALREKAERLLMAGGTVIINAVFDREEERSATEALAAKLGVPFTGIWLEADSETLASRVISRHKGPSDANLDVLHRQLLRDPGDLRWHRIDTSRPIDQVVNAVLELSAG
ncbi:bifunctional aminoglycoside phosphotransferase/ATP-binding protein [Ciceribacter sp. L1K22]|uniref:bifunctional aminoglycoside phosphotransferase/ATP-binding protein n=1 Tax=Ciceribacter sp. L1K22 TaxID=2820275 RepID=UPI001ABDA63C|nr:bifunctional aminoglycoside phosphotransferase/ATP-binding protein [Ciceribacter sp. L1K22]MBO3758148.1 AAA family ATPase [Ciceribacter sp. L1K22]